MGGEALQLRDFIFSDLSAPVLGGGVGEEAFRRIARTYVGSECIMRRASVAVSTRRKKRDRDGRRHLSFLGVVYFRVFP